MQEDLFGNEVIKDVLLRDIFLEPPFTVLDSKGGAWQNRRRKWKELGITSEEGRDVVVLSNFDETKYGRKGMTEASVFDPALCELMYRWFCPSGGEILDVFAGGSVRGIVANYLGFKYNGIDIRPEQIESNNKQGQSILAQDNQPNWICGDSNIVLDTFINKVDFLFTCPPYADLEVYSNLPGDISNMDYNSFVVLYRSIINKSCNNLKSGCYAGIVVGDIRDKKGNYRGFVRDTIRAYTDAGLKFYNDAVLLNSLGTAMLRCARPFDSGKLTKVHQNVLIFKKL